MKSERHALILSLIEKKNVETQEDLAELLKERGVAVTQATVSRDIKELRLIKVLSETGGYKYATVDKAEARHEGKICKNIQRFRYKHNGFGKSYNS